MRAPGVTEAVDYEAELVVIVGTGGRNIPRAEAMSHVRGHTIVNGITLMPGDVIATGTPAGVGIGFTPPQYLKVGDRVAVAIGGIGTLENPVAEI